MRRLLGGVLLLVVAAGFAACDGGDGDGGAASGGAATTTTADAATTTTTDADADADAGGPFSTTAVSTPPGQLVGLLAAVRAAEHDGYVRVVFEFEKELPGYTVDYTERPIREDASGDEVELKGEEALLLRFEPSSGTDLTGEEYREVYKGPDRIAIASDEVPEVVRTGDFEALMHWAVGLDERRPFRVTTLSAPARIVLDVSTG